MDVKPDHLHGPSTDGRERVVVVGLIATPPDQPARIVDLLVEELPDLLRTHVDHRVRWDVRSNWGSVAPRRDGGITALLDDVAERRETAGWDLTVCLTDLPLHVARMPLVAHFSLRRRAGLVSLPALGLGQFRAARTAVVGLVEGLAVTLVEERTRPREETVGRLVEGLAPVRRVVDHADDGEIGFVSSRVTGRLRLLVGMVRANRPGRALLGLSKLLVAAFGTAAIALTSNTIWLMSDALDGPRLALVMLVGLAGLVGWLIVAHDLWERPSGDTSPELARLFNMGTVLTLGLATCVSYLVLLAGTVAAAALLIDPSVLSATLDHPVGLGDYAVLAWIISSLATVGGAIGSGLEDEENVRAAAYGHHPTPTGWRDDPTPDDATADDATPDDATPDGGGRGDGGRGGA